MGTPKDAAVYTINRDSLSDSSDVDNLFSAPEEIILHTPSYITQIAAQKGVCIAHKNLLKPIDITLSEMERPITKTIMSHACFAEIRDKLDWCGIDRSFVYPGLDSVASYVDLKARQLHILGVLSLFMAVSN